MRKLSVFTFSVLIVTVLVFLISCPAEQPESDAFVSIDMIPLHGVARKYMDTGTIDLDSHLTEVYFDKGWSEPFAEEGGAPPSLVAAVEGESILRYRVLEPADRWLSFKFGIDGPYGKLARQEFEIFVTEKNILKQVEVTEQGGEPFLVYIPASMQNPGMNKLQFKFSEFVPDPEYEKSTRRERRREVYPGIAGYFSDLKFYYGDAEGPKGAEIKAEPDVIRMLADSRVLGQFPNSELVYAFEVRPETSFILTGRAQSPKGDAGDLLVSVSTKVDGEREWRDLWREEFSFGDAGGSKAFKNELALDHLAGKPVLIRLGVHSDSESRSAGVVWQRLALTFPREAGQIAGAQRSPVRLKDRVTNVVIIILDALRYNMLGCYGSDEGLTPNIDEFAGDALIFRNAITAAPYTIASTSTLFSSLLPESHGVRDGLDVFPEDIQNLARTFKENGYYTAALSGAPFITRKYGITRDCDLEIYLRPDEDKDLGISTMDLVLLKQGIKQVADSGKPAFIYIHYLPPHWPYRPPPPFDKRFIDSSVVTDDYRKKIRAFKGDSESPEVKELFLHYKNNLLYADYLIEQTLEILQRHGLYENSLVVLTADHGEAFAEHGALEHGNTVYDEMIKIPLIIRVPGGGGKVIEQQVGAVDFFPTLVEILDLKMREKAKFEGRSIAPLLAGMNQKPVDYYFSRASGEKLKFSLRGGRYKYIFNDYSDELYDLLNDPSEKENIAARMPALASALRQQGLLLVATNSARRGGERQEVELTEEEEKELRNLGYLQ